MTNPNPKEKWASKLGLILVVASSAIGLGNFLRFPGQVAKNGGGAFMVPYLVSFLILGIPVCLSEWIMGRMGGKNGHSSVSIFRTLLGDGKISKISATIAILIPTLIYVYYVFIEAWCLSYAIDFLIGNINLSPENISPISPEYSSEIVKNSKNYFINLTGASMTGKAFETKIIPYTLLCYSLNYFIVYRGLSKGLEALAKISVPLMLISSVFVLIRVLSLDGITNGLGYMWNPDWASLLKGEVWVAAAGQIFFSLSVGFGIVLIFTSYLTEKDDVTLSGITAASLNEMVEVVFGGMITIPVGFLFLGMSVASFGVFGMGFIALPSVFTLMPAGRFFGMAWFFILFLAALTSSVTMLQPGINFLEEGFHFKRKNSITLLSSITFILTMGIIYFNHDFTALDVTDFWVGTMLIYILATIQVLIYGWKIGPARARLESEKGAILILPKFFDFIIKYITPSFLLIILAVFIKQSFFEYYNKMNPYYWEENASLLGVDLVSSVEKARISLGVFVILIIIFILTYIMVNFSIKKNKGVTKWN
jgi:neurotransmitter:Na+ symporter, NSS family